MTETPDPAQEATIRHAVLDRLATLIDGVRRPHPTRVAVDGPDAAGKTVMADELAEVLRGRGREVVRAGIDGFHRPRAERVRRGSESPEGYYRDSFDHAALERHLLEPLGPGGTRRFRAHAFDYRADVVDLAVERTAGLDAVLLLDGVFLLRPELRGHWDFSVYVSVEPEEILRRAVVRDAAAMGGPDVVLARYDARYLPGQRLYRSEVDPIAVADRVVLNDDPSNPVMTP